MEALYSGGQAGMLVKLKHMLTGQQGRTSSLEKCKISGW